VDWLRPAAQKSTFKIFVKPYIRRMIGINKRKKHLKINLNHTSKELTEK
jgi:hypothetical protein